MAEGKIQEIEQKRYLIWVQYLTLLGIAILSPIFPWQQVTGPLVNAILFIAVVLIGMKEAMVLAVMPSLMALAFGTLLPIAAPMVPFIIIGNIILVTVFAYFRQQNFWLGVVCASVLKFIWLYCWVLYLARYIHNPIFKNIIVKMSWPQLASALAGGVLAYVFLKSIKRI